MGIFGRLFGKKPAGPGDAHAAAPRFRPSADAPASISLVDEFGRRVEMPREEWRTKVLPGHLRRHWDDADGLAAAVSDALRDEFVEEAEAAAERLFALDGGSARSAAILAWVHSRLGRLAKAQDVLTCALQRHGEDGLLLLNLAKVQDGLGRREEADRTLWRALEVGPNQGNALHWYALRERERHGEPALLAAYERVARLPGSWQAQVLLAKRALEARDVPRALALYRTALAQGEADLGEISGDLGQHGHLRELVDLCAPRFDVARHGLMLGNNLLKAFVDLKDAANARKVLGALLAAQRPDWRATLTHWEAEIDKLGIPAGRVEAPVTLTLLALEGPLWARAGSPYAALLPPKAADAVTVAVLGGTVAPKPGKDPDHVTLQTADVRGRVSRALPLFAAEELDLRTDARVTSQVPWVTAGGFALLTAPWGADALEHLARKPDYLVTTHLAAGHVETKVFRAIDGAEVAAWEVALDPEHPEDAAAALADHVAGHFGPPERPLPALLAAPARARLAPYLACLENALAVAAHVATGADSLYGPRSILDQLLRTAADDPTGVRSRFLLLASLERMAERNAALVRELEAPVRSLQRQSPLPPAAQEVADAALARLWPPSGNDGV